MTTSIQLQIKDLKEGIEKQLTLQKEYFERVLLEKDKAINIALAAAKEAVAVAENSAEKWRASANEWRGAMNDREVTFLHKGEFTTFKEALDKNLDEIKKSLNFIAGEKKGWHDGWGWLAGIVGLVLAILGYFK